MCVVWCGLSGRRGDERTGLLVTILMSFFSTTTEASRRRCGSFRAPFSASARRRPARSSTAASSKQLQRGEQTRHEIRPPPARQQHRPPPIHTLNMAANALNTIYRFAIPLAAGVGLAQASLYDVKGGNRAIIFDRLSGVREGVVNEGTHFLIPWLQKAIVYDVRTKPRNISTTTGSKDLQMVSLTLRVLHRPEVSKLSTIYQVRLLYMMFVQTRNLTSHKEPRPRLRRACPPLHRKRSPQGYCRTIRCRRAHYPA